MFVVILTLTDPVNLLYGSERTVCALINVQTGDAKEAPASTTAVTLVEFESCVGVCLH